MKINGTLDLNYLYANGYFKSEIDEASADLMLNHIKEEQWIEDQEASAIVLNPGWDQGKSVETKNVPAFYQNFLERFRQTEFLKKYEELYGVFTASSTALHKSPRTYINRWHGHFMDGYHIHLLFHFSPDKRDIEDGGFIEFGLALDSADFHVDFEKYNQKDPKNVFRTGSYISHHGQFEVLLNSHPMYRHQVTEVLTDKDRYTLMYFLGYKDNILQSKKNINNL